MKTANRNITILVTLALVLVFSLTVTTSFAFAEGLALNSLAYVNVDTFLNLRLEPQGEIIGQIPDDEIVTILSKIDRNGYYKIRVNRTQEEGYVYGEYLSSLYYFSEDYNYSNTTSNTSETKDDYTVITIDGLTEGTTLVVTSKYKLNMREKPNVNGPRVKYLYLGDTLQVLSTQIENDYIYVKDVSTNLVGYVNINYVAVVNSDISTDHECCSCCKNCTCCECQQW